MPSWYESFLRTGKLPDGRHAFGVHLAEDKVYAVFSPEVLLRAGKGLSVPWPGEVADDGYVTPWEVVDVSPAS